MADDLYDRDFYLWTQAQAEALRSHVGASNVLDYEHLAEELDDLGRSERGKASSAVFRITQHLYKLEATHDPQVSGHWRGEVGNFRPNAENALTFTIRNDIEDDLDRLHRKAAKVAQDSMAAHEPDVEIDRERRWTLPQILGEVDDPLDGRMLHRPTGTVIRDAWL